MLKFRCWTDIEDKQQFNENKYIAFKMSNCVVLNHKLSVDHWPSVHGAMLVSVLTPDSPEQQLQISMANHCQTLQQLMTTGLQIPSFVSNYVLNKFSPSQRAEISQSATDWKQVTMLLTIRKNIQISVIFGFINKLAKVLSRWHLESTVNLAPPQTPRQWLHWFYRQKDS